MSKRPADGRYCRHLCHLFSSFLVSPHFSARATTRSVDSVNFVYECHTPSQVCWRYPPLGSISAVSRVRSLILREESSFRGWVRAHFPEQRPVIEPNPPPHLKKGGWTQASPHFLHFLTKATWQPSSKDKTKTIIISVNPLRLWIIFSVAEK